MTEDEGWEPGLSPWSTFPSGLYKGSRSLSWWLRRHNGSRVTLTCMSVWVWVVRRVRHASSGSSRRDRSLLSADSIHENRVKCLLLRFRVSLIKEVLVYRWFSVSVLYISVKLRSEVPELVIRSVSPLFLCHTDPVDPCKQSRAGVRWGPDRNGGLRTQVTLKSTPDNHDPPVSSFPYL